MSERASGLPNPSHPVDWILFEGNLGSLEMRRIFSENNFIQTMLRVEAALARSEAKLGVIPQEAAEEIAKVTRIPRSGGG